VKKIDKICLTVVEDQGYFRQLANAIQVTFWPFISLMNEINIRKLSYDLARWVNAKPGEHPSFSAYVIRDIWEHQTSHPFKIEFGEDECTLRTSFLKTKIRICRFAGGCGVEVDFGDANSTAQAMSILAAAELAEVRFIVYSQDDLIKHADILNALVARARKRIKKINDIPLEHREKEMDKAQREIVCFKRALEVMAV